VIKSRAGIEAASKNKHTRKYKPQVPREKIVSTAIIFYKENIKEAITQFYYSFLQESEGHRIKFNCK